MRTGVPPAEIRNTYGGICPSQYEARSAVKILALNVINLRLW